MVKETIKCEDVIGALMIGYEHIRGIGVDMFSSTHLNPRH